MNWQLIPESNSQNKAHQDDYDKLLSKFLSRKCNIQSEVRKQSMSKNSFKCVYEKAYLQSQSVDQMLVIEGYKFSLGGKIVCKKCNNYRPKNGCFLYICECSNYCDLDITITNMSSSTKINMQVSIEQTNSKLKNIFKDTIDLQKDEKYPFSWKFVTHSLGPKIIYNSNQYVNGDEYFTKEGNLTLVCDIEVLEIKDQEGIAPGLGERLAERFSDLNINPTTPSDQFADVILCVENDKIYCHKLILAMASKVFEKMFVTGMKESKDKEIVLKEIDLETLKSLLTFIYTEKIAEEKIDIKLLAAADMYDVINLKRICIDKLSRIIDQENIVDIWITAYLHNVANLTQEATIYLATNWKTLVRRDDIRELCRTYPGLLFTISSLTANQ